ncbi:MAG: NUDIX domain-containing protein [Ilumatobacter sp.]|uniref:NUDIX domain-containing protein n=1 Tax=Ilumatobacter sp. TaxID=1967498 RepID=UPI0032996E64
MVLWRRVVERGVTTPAGGGVQVLLGHMGGPFWSRKDDGAWSIPKGLPDAGEEPIDAARREFTEELGLPLPPGELVDLGEFRQSSRKTVTAWALELAPGDTLDVEAIVSNTFEMEWPARSGRTQSFPEVDRAAWFDLDTACRKVAGGQAAVFDLLIAAVDPG